MKGISKEVKIGIAGVLAIAALYCGINFLKGINLFKKSNTYYVQFQDVCALTNSSPVFADGYRVGIVRDIIYDYTHPGNVIVAVDLDDNMRVPKGSTASLETEMLGTVKMNLLLANNPRERVEPGDTIPGNVEDGIMDAAEDLVPQIQQLLPKVDSILMAVNALVNDPSLLNTMHNTEAITANLNSMSSKMNRMMDKLPAVTDNINKVCENAQTLTTSINNKVNEIDVNGTLQRVDQTLADVQQLTNKLNSTDNTVGLMLNDPALYNNLSRTADNAAALLEDLKSHPKRYVHFSIFGRKDK